MKNIKKLLSLLLVLIFVIASFCVSSVLASEQEKKLVFDAGIDYSGVQGQNNWYYKYRKIDNDIEGELIAHAVYHTNNRWYAETSANRDLGMICGPNDAGSWTQNVMFTGMYVNKVNGQVSDTVLYTSAREFKAPYTGIVEISASDLHGQSANTKAYLRILHNGKKIWPVSDDWRFISGNSDVDFSSIEKVVSKDDSLVFEVKRATVGTLDNEINAGVVANQGVAWTPVITYKTDFLTGKEVYDFAGEKYGLKDENGVFEVTDNLLVSNGEATLTVAEDVSNLSVCAKIKPSSLSDAVNIYPYYKEGNGYSVCVNNSNISILKDGVSKTSATFTFGADTSYYVKAAAFNFGDGTYISAFVDGVEVVSYFDKENCIQSGSIAIKTKSVATIEDIIIETIEKDIVELGLIEDADNAIKASVLETTADNVALAFEKIELVSNKVALAAFEARMESIMSSFAYIRASADKASKKLKIDGMAYSLKNQTASITIKGPDNYSSIENVSVDDKGNFSVEHTIPYLIPSGKFTVSVESENLTSECDYERALDLCDMTSFSLDGVNGKFDGTKITVNLTEKTDLKSMIALFETSEKTTVYVGEKVQVSGTTENNFKNKVEYKVVAEDGTEKVYTIKVNPYVAPSSSGGGSSSSRKPSSVSAGMIVTVPTITESNIKQDDITPKFSDVQKEHWAFDYVEKLYALGAVKGDENGNFNPDAKITRAEFVKLLVEILNLDNMGDISFYDVNENDWYYKYVNIAYTNGLVNGVSETNFYPDAQITREDMALIISRAFTSLKADDKALDFKDTENISSYALDAVKVLFANNIISGNNGFFNPKDNASRCEAAKIIALCVK